MGQGQSITTFDYDHVNQFIKASPQYIEDQWQSSGNGGKMTYWQSINKTLKATIDKNEWPLTASRMKFNPGHHFFSISNGDKFYYDVEDDAWVDLTPPEMFNEFIDKWHELLKSAENTANLTPEQRQQATAEARRRRTTQPAEKTVTRTVTRTNGPAQSGGAIGNLTDEDLTQITILFEHMLQPLEDKVHQLQAQVDQLHADNATRSTRQTTRRTVTRQ